LLASTHPPACPFSGSHEKLPAQFRTKLEEKTHRYAHLLDIARSSVRLAPEPTTTSYDYAGRILTVAAVYAGHGDSCRLRGSSEDALASFSYGHGWLDAGVTAGFFRIISQHDLFTV
jgi:hypothetical protein